MKVKAEPKSTVRANFKLKVILCVVFIDRAVKQGKRIARRWAFCVLLPIQHDREVPGLGLLQQGYILPDLLNLALVLLDVAGVGRIYFPLQRELLVAPRAPQDFQLRHSVFQLHLLRQHGIVCGSRLKLRGGKHGFVYILTGSCNTPACHNLCDIAQFLFLYLPEIGVKCTFRHKLFDNNLWVFVALPDPAPIPLGNIRRLPGTV